MPKRLFAGLFAATLLLSGGGVSAMAQNNATQQSGACVGKVLDSNGDPIVGATVQIAGTTNGTMTNIDGDFSLTGVKKGAKVTVSAIGYAAGEQVWNGSALYFTLDEKDSLLDEVVVVGYGVQKKVNVTGSVSSMKAEAIADRAIGSVSAAMAGEMPGVTVVQSSGQPGSQTGSITVRGANTINSGSPLVIVDGVPGSMNNIDPQDVESISVLKDAASAAIYGVQAANGVILITTKTGKLNTAPVINYSGSVNFVKPTTKLPKVNAYWHTKLYREAMLNEDPNANVETYDALLQQYESGQLDKEGTDWYGETFRSAATETQHTVQINGGSANTTYMASLGYLYQGGLLEQTDYNRYNGRVNLDSKIKPWLAAGIMSSFYRGISKDGYTGYSGIMQHCNRVNATLPIRDENGEFVCPGGMQNPVAEAIPYSTGYVKTINDQLFANLYLNITPIQGLSIKPLFSWRHDYRDYRTFRNQYYYGGRYNCGDNAIRRGDHNYYNWDWYTYQVTANYNKQFGNHGLAILAGFESQKYTYYYTTASRQAANETEGDNLLDKVLNSLPQTGMSNSDSGNGLNRQSWFGRVQYDYASRYLAEVNFRADASSRFPKDSRWGYFPSVSAAWRLSEEAFMENTRTWLDNLKIRLGWGKTGNEELSEYYPGVATYAFSNPIIGLDKLVGAYESRYVNNMLKWATVENYEVGLEGAFLGNMITFEGSFYKKKTDGMLLNLPIIEVIGVDAPAQNAGSVENYGVDINIGHKYRINKDWSYSVALNFAYNHNEITNLCGTEGPVPGNTLMWYKEGEAVGSYYGYICDGIFKNEEEVKAGPLRTGREKPGNLRFKDIDGDGKITADDRTTMGKLNPTWTGGLTVDVRFRDFDLSMLWQGAWDYNRYMTAEASQAFYNNGTALDWQKDRWTPENPNGSYPRLYTNSSGSPDVVNNSFWCEDASYARLKNLTIGYTLPTRISEKAGINKARVYLNGENLLTFSKLYDKGVDPEAPAGRGAYYANVKKFSIGLKLTF